MVRRQRARLVALGAGMAFILGTGVMVATGPSAHATGLVQITSCGQTVSSDAVVTRSLRCAGDGVVVAGADVTVDLGGYTIRSTTGHGSGVFINGPTGAAATVQGPGKVSGFAVGIGEAPSSIHGHHLVVDGVDLTSNGWGILVISGVTDVHATSIRGANGIGGICVNCPSSIGNVSVDSSSIATTGVALDVNYAGDGTVTHSAIRGGLVSVAVSSGLSFSDSSLRNVHVDCDEAGIVIERSNLVNTMVTTGSTCGGAFRDNNFRSTKGGTALTLGISGSFASVIDGNRFSGWDDAVTVSPHTYGLEVTGNRFDHNGTGLAARACDSSSKSTGTVRNNTVSYNKGDGIALACGVWAVGGNRMVANGGLGFNAPGVAPGTQITDEGGNVAAHNAEPQCVGVVCLPG